MTISHILVTHGNCPDGAAAAVIAKKIQPSTQVVFGIHQEINSQVKESAQSLQEFGTLWIADICCDASILEEASKILRRKKGYLGVYEHHETRKWLAEYTLPADLNGEIVFDDKRCGAKIFFEELTKTASYAWEEDYQEFIELTNDRDLWLNQHSRSKTLAKLHHILGDEKYLARFLKNPSVEFSPEEEVLLDYLAKKEREAIHKAMERIQLAKDENGFDYGVIYGEGNSSDLLNYAIGKHNLEYAVLINLHTKRGSIRSRGNMDCTQYAKRYGGGGHVRASGFRFDYKPPKF